MLCKSCIFRKVMLYFLQVILYGKSHPLLVFYRHKQTNFDALSRLSSDFVCDKRHLLSAPKRGANSRYTPGTSSSSAALRNIPFFMQATIISGMFCAFGRTQSTQTIRNCIHCFSIAPSISTIFCKPVRILRIFGTCLTGCYANIRRKTR